MSLPNPAYIQIAVQCVNDIQKKNRRLKVVQEDATEVIEAGDGLIEYYDGQPNAQVWYVVSSGTGFTQDSRIALKDYEGHPVLAPGNMVQIIHAMEIRCEAIKKQHRTAWQDKLWSLLFEALETPEDTNKGKARRSAEATGLAKAIAMITYGNAEDENLDKVRAEAQEAYNE